MLGQSHPGAAAADPPQPGQWHQGFLVVMDAIRETKTLSKDLEDKLKAALEGFTATFA